MLQVANASKYVCTNCHTACGEDQLYCQNCGCILLYALKENKDALRYATAYLGSLDSKKAGIQWGTSYFHSRARLFFQIGDSHNVISATIGSAPIVIGRQGGSAIPHVDLTRFGGLDLGVSRYHVRIERKQDALYVTDLDSNNGTFLNHQRLTPHESDLLRNRAVLQLGKIVLRVQYV